MRRAVNKVLAVMSILMVVGLLSLSAISFSDGGEGSAAIGWILLAPAACFILVLIQLAMENRVHKRHNLERK